MARPPEPSWADGMRSLRPEEFPSLTRLLGEVFRPSLVAEYPHVYTPDHAATLRVVVRDGEVVSHIGTLRRHASLLGCTVRVACLGGVATHQDHRGQGHGTALFADTMRVCGEDGVDFIHVSGYRKMYHRFGCRYVGRYLRFEVTAEQAARLADSGLRLAAATLEDTGAMAQAYRREPVRWLRPPSDFEHSLTGFVMNHPARVHMIRDGTATRGYVVLQRPAEGHGQGRLLEYAGDRPAVGGALGELMRACGLQSLELHVRGGDDPLRDILRRTGAEGEAVPTSGTVTVIAFERLMERLRPLFVERAGEDAARGLVCREEDDHFVFACGGDRVVAPDRGAAAQLIFGTADGTAERELLEGGGAAAKVLRRVLPVPALWYGVNYV